MSKHRDNAIRLSYFTVGYNILEGAVSILFAVRAGSSALLGFGADSLVESLSGMVMIWRFSRGRDLPIAHEQRIERTAIRLVGLSLIVLAFYVVYESAAALYLGEKPERSPVGLLIAIASLVVMPTLFFLKRSAATALKSRSLAADAKQTLACVLLSLALVAGTGLHYITGIWQADPIAGLFIAAFLMLEGYKAWTEQNLCSC